MLMSVRARDGFFHLDFRFRGKRYRLSTGIAYDPTDKKFKETEKFVNDWDATIRREIAMRTFVLENHFPQFGQSPSKPVLETFRETAEKWLKSHRNSWAEWTYRKYRDALRSRIYPKIGDRPTAGLKAIDVRLLREQIIEDGKIKGGKLSNRRVNRIMSPVTGILNELFED